MSGPKMMTPGGGAVRFHAWVRAVLLVVFLLLGAGAYLLDSRWAGLGRFSPRTSTAQFLAMLFLAAAAYEFVALLIQAAVELRGGAGARWGC